jgi:hypothetical protein
MARRAVDADELELLVSTIDKRGPNTSLLLEGMLSSMEGRTDLTTPSNWKILSDNLQQSSGRNKDLAVRIAELFGDTEATQTNRRTTFTFGPTGDEA